MDRFKKKKTKVSTIITCTPRKKKNKILVSSKASRFFNVAFPSSGTLKTFYRACLLFSLKKKKSSHNNLFFPQLCYCMHTMMDKHIMSNFKLVPEGL